MPRKFRPPSAASISATAIRLPPCGAHTDADGILWITGERYARKQTIHEHACYLPRQVTWYADPAGAEDIAALRQFGLAVRRGFNDIRSGIAAVRARLETGKLKVVRSSCPNLFAEALQYRYPSTADGQTANETPLDESNHALAALRYLVARLDHAFIRTYRRQFMFSDASEKRCGFDASEKRR